jgi:L-lactate dehydrogenase (cytochrome)
MRAKIETLVVTVDVCVAANRENFIREGFSTPLRPSLWLAWQGLTHPRWLIDTLLRTMVTRGVPHFENSHAARGVPIISRSAERDFGARDRFTWQHIAHIRQQWKGRLIVKGLLHADDVRLARGYGVDGVIVSNHGGRQLDGTIGALRALPGALEAADDMPVMIDGGFRRGTDILKALALGARMVFVGRPFLYAAVAAGEQGVRLAIERLRGEVNRNMALLGLERLSAISREYVQPLRGEAID